MIITLVISRYNEDLEWLKSELFSNIHNIIIYNKGINNNFYGFDKYKVINLPNVGRDAHTYFYHISKKYKTYLLLDSITIFLPGSIELPHKYNRAIKLVETVIKENVSRSLFSCIEENPSVLDNLREFKIDSYISSNKLNKKINNDDNMRLSKIRPLGKWLENILEIKSIDELKPIKWCNMNLMFALSSEDIINRPIDFYDRIIREIDEHHNHEVVHYIERTMPYLFSLLNDENFI